MNNINKQAQFIPNDDLDGFNVGINEKDTNDLRVDLELEPEDSDEQSVFEDGATIEGDIAVKVDNDVEEEKHFSFELPQVPGADNQDDLPEPEIKVDDEEDIHVEDDPWDWKKSEDVLKWMHEKLNNIPRHSGRDLLGIDKAIAYLDACERSLDEAIRRDINNKIDTLTAEKIKEEIFQGKERLSERRDKIVASKYTPKNKKKKKADDSNDQIVKEAQKASGFQINVPLFISAIARICINSMVYAGHDIEVTANKLFNKFKMNDREKLEITQLLQDMGYHVFRDRGFLLDEDIDPRSSDNMDFPAQYNA